ncbi:DUF1080 domain-containing protein [Rapidithrix thailandica]|uniref:DUF1080 domain-containing protein n=1 Tax=Rapidithrix thailandica TaxID=413964 RepID=A0AAW9S467_9BACT
MKMRIPIEVFRWLKTFLSHRVPLRIAGASSKKSNCYPPVSTFKALLCIAYMLGFGSVLAQEAVSLKDLSAFNQAGSSWHIAGNVKAGLFKERELQSEPGEGVLVNLPGKKQPGKDLFTQWEHGSMDLELDYMMAKNSNSGIYLQGRYEIQLLDSWGVKQPRSGDNGGIYERWDDSKPQGQKGYQGYAPRQNASRAPGLWQHLKISFQAPRFDASGNKIENARILYIQLNGVTIHEDVELFGPTRGAVSSKEVAQAPLRIQGDHGPVAFKNIRVRHYNTSRPQVEGLSYSLYKGKFDSTPDFTSLQPESKGNMTAISTQVNPTSKEFLVRYTGTLNVKKAGEYHFRMDASGGWSTLKIKENTLKGSGKVILPLGKVAFELLYSKKTDWASASLGVAVSGPGLREVVLSQDPMNPGRQVDPILVHARENTILRSFMDLPGSPRVVHAVSVGSPEQVHYTYDLDKGMLVQVWRGGFLNTTPMWHSRGDGSSRPLGMVQHFGKPALTLGKLSSTQSQWATDTTGTSYVPKGYILDAQGQPTFTYLIYNTRVRDAIRVLNNGQGIQRQLIAQHPADQLYARLASGSNIEEVEKGLYVIDNKSYYVQLDAAAKKLKPIIRDNNGQKELIVPFQNQLNYHILF